MSAGAEHSCQIDATEMDAATRKLMALADGKKLSRNKMESRSLESAQGPEPPVD
ncbi:unnamed protein product [Penicillium salamii]|nr:unnamed protein product [Penicillium salamii]